VDEPIHIRRTDPAYPSSLYLHLADRAPTTLTARGKLDLLQRKPLVALFCSVQCSETIILQTYDLAQALGDAGVTVISGFHSPLEKECLTALLERSSPAILCPARSIERLRLRKEWGAALLHDRLLLLSSFDEPQQETTTQRALERNVLVAALADALLVAHATPKGRIEQLCDDVLAWGKPVFALEDADNSRLLALGAKRIWIDHIRKGEAFV
jgi:predicted Rossmann fold nucleotide-binding protein DprA/Smf involved in DNA uptake